MVNLHDMVRAVSPRINDMRNRIHENPELGLKEYATGDLLESYIRENVAYDSLHRVGETGLFVEIKGKRSGKDRAIIIRGDMDALPIQEDQAMSPCSRIPGVMHACGHDVHAGIAAGTACLLGQLKDLFSGSVYIFLQPAEEILAGAKLFLDDPAIDFSKVEAAFAAHCSPEVDAGSIGVRYGGILASSDEFRIIVHGKGGHGAHCHTVIDPVVAASSIVMNLQTLVSRQTSPADSAVLSVCSIHGGKAFNIIPDEVELLGTVRTVDEATRDAMETGVSRIASATADALRAKAEVIYTRGVPPLTNKSEWVDRAVRVGNSLLGKDHVVMLPHPSMGGEDFAFVMEKYPGVFIRLGARTPGGPYGSLHSSTFYCDPAAISAGLLTLTGVALDYFGVPVQEKEA